MFVWATAGKRLASCQFQRGFQVGQRSFSTQIQGTPLFREKAYVNGSWVEAAKGNVYNVLNPSNGEKLGQCPNMGPEDMNNVIDVAEAAFQLFKTTSAKQRAEILRRWFTYMQENEDHLAQILMLENGRPITGALQEIRYAASFIDWFSGEAVRSYGYTTESSLPGNRVITVKQPVGVVGVITPWNFPSAMITRKVAGAIAAGCSVIVKPAAETPFSALALAELAARAGVPAGVLNVVTTSVENTDEVGKVLCTHPTVKKLSFTGSTRVGKLIMERGSTTLKKCSFELGGNAPFIIFRDADIKLTIESLLSGKYRASGQTCVSPNRVFVQEGVHEEFVAALKVEVEKRLHIGPLDQPDTTLECLINKAATDKVERLVTDAKNKGAKVVCGGERALELGETFFPATIMTDMNSDMQASKEEIFGPLIAVYKFKTEDEVVAMANDSPVGLAAYIFTTDYGTSWRMAEKLEVGMTGINTTTISDPVAPFGGVKESGFGREGGRYGMEEFQIQKTITLGGLGLSLA